MADRVVRKKSEKLEVRLTEHQKNRIKILAKEYAGGNLSLWVVHNAVEGERRYLVPKARK